MSTSWQIVNLDRFEPVRIGFRQARGMPLDCSFRFISNAATATAAAYDIAGANPQLVLRPKSKYGASGYDMTVVDAINGTAHVDVPGPSINDPNGYRAEVYFRDTGGQPTRMVAEGQLSYTGGAYQTEGPLGPATYPTVTGPAGPAGIQGVAGPPGPKGTRGSMWFTGHGSPTLIGEVEGDMWLDVDTGEVWSWTPITASWVRA